jgi:hypothetical protein
MSTGALAGAVMVPFFGALLCITPAITRPTVPFGVRVPAERARATVIRRERHAYYGRTAVIGACCTIAAVLLRGHGSWWLTRIILLLEVAADLGCFWIARSKMGSALPILPFAVGLVVLAVVAFRTGQGGFRLSGAAAARGPAAATDRDDDRFWKAGLIYLNRDDPAIMVGARFGVGWTFNVANPMAWLVIAGIVAAPLGLAAIIAAAGL